MTDPSLLPRLCAAIHGTWPAKSTRRLGPFTLRDGDGGGQRVSAATCDEAGTAGPDESALDDAIAAMARPLFMVRPGQSALDAALAARGFALKDPTDILVTPTDRLTGTPVPRVTTFAIWEPLQIMRDIWAEGGTDAARLRVMDRAPGPKTGILGRIDDQPAAAAFVAIHDGIAMLHALEIRPAHRRKGLAVWMMRQAAIWAADHGAAQFSVLVTAANAPAQALYASLGLTHVGQYHYRIKDQAP
ncbi:GNAT family N-acetyltransferase [Pseudaestuariivita atlantica]|uniref:Acetyltransferase n=1 Tax=Pseudaestuariivita atlantica TaxID=1317121 RepID=A0A0L1JSL6_9RHOB|nr:GNAT family N-acetyltransferase [Pseudaestuariivita atlantica]KNG94697.1 acetyltransferase [Pseudaestuariivita atlantica]